MEQIRDCAGRLVCSFDASTGELIQSYKKCRIRTILHSGDTFFIEREGIRTAITRIQASAVKVESKITTT